MRHPESLRQWLADSLGVLQTLAKIESASEAELAPFQEAAVQRGVEIARRVGGVLLADTVGMGKTRTALAIARVLARDCTKQTGTGRRVYVCMPSRLRVSWHRAAAAAGWDPEKDLHLLSHTELSRRSHFDPKDPPSVVIVDEAHAFRNPEARRSRHLASLTARAPAILVTATPVCNKMDDLYHLLRLFLADHDLRGLLGVDLDEAFRLAAEGNYDLTELVEHLAIRRTIPAKEGFGERPKVSMEVISYDPPEDEAWIWGHLARELGELSLVLIRHEWPRQLFVEYVLKRWESGPDALAETLRRLVDYHERWLEAKSQGRPLSRADFRRLFGQESRRDQGVFAFVYDQGKDGGEQVVLKEVVEEDRARLEALLNRVQKVIHEGGGAPAAMATLIDSNPDSKFLIFSTYQRAARGIYEALRGGMNGHRALGLVTGRGAWATGLGKTTAQEIITRFAPRASGLAALPAHQGIDILVCTDCLSEGINLQDCSRIILADLPYSPLKIEQRIGRLVRPGAAGTRVIVYWLRPTQWEDTLGLRRRLDHKLEHASTSGVSMTSATMSLATSAVVDGEPLAALTNQDLFASSLGAAPWTPQIYYEPVFYRALSRRGPPGLYLRVILEDGPRRRPSWCIIDPSGRVSHRLWEALPRLIELSDEDAPLTLAEPTAFLLHVALSFLDEETRLLQAARAAPTHLPANSPQQKVWRRLCEEVHDKERLEALRPKILRPFARGLEGQLEVLIGTEERLERLLRRLENLPEYEESRPGVVYRILWGVEVQ